MQAWQHIAKVTRHVVSFARLLLCGLMCLGCQNEDYPTVEYAPPGTLFEHPDLRLDWQSFQLDQTKAVKLEDLAPVGLDARLELQIGVEGSSELQFVPLTVQLRQLNGEPVGGGSSALQQGETANRLEGVVSLRGPDRPGRYRLEVRVKDQLPGPEPELSDWRVLGEAILHVSQSAGSEKRVVR